MAQLPNVKMRLGASAFDLLITVLEHNALHAPDTRTQNNAKDLMNKRLRYTRSYFNRDGDLCADMRMYEDEAAEMIWQLLLALECDFSVETEYCKGLKSSGARGEG